MSANESRTMNFKQSPFKASALARRWQSGGTVTGVIVGLIIGLTVAVWVAMTIMKTPLPFVDKLGKQTQPAGELGDPNKTMPGGARERRERMPDTDAETPPASPTNKPARAEPEPAISSVSNSPAAEKPRNDKPAAPAVPAASPSPAVAPAASTSPAQVEGFTYYLQAGAFREMNDADATKAKLALMGVAATIAERKSELGTLYRVRVGPFSEIEAMNRTRVRLSDNGVDAAVVRVPK